MPPYAENEEANDDKTDLNIENSGKKIGMVLLHFQSMCITDNKDTEDGKGNEKLKTGMRNLKVDR